MKMNTRRKGRRLETLVKKYLEAEGYLVEQEKVIKFQQQDFFGLWDIIAFGQHWPYNELLIQVKTGNCDKKLLEKIEAFKVPEGISKQVWVYKPHKKIFTIMLWESGKAMEKTLMTLEKIKSAGCGEWKNK